MTKPYFENKFTIGNVIQIGLLLLALVVGWIRLEGKADANAKEIHRNAESIYQLRVQQQQREFEINKFWREDWAVMLQTQTQILTEIKHLKEKLK